MTIKSKDLPTTKGSHKKVDIECDGCKSIFQREYRYVFKIRERNRTTDDLCKSCSFSGKKNPAYGKTYRTKETHPEWAKKIYKSTKGKINVGDANGMKQKEAQQKVSKARKRMFKDPALRREYSKKTRKAWADGKFDGVSVGQCKWYSYTKKDGTVIKCQGTWELAFAKWADNKGLKFDCHKGRIKYIDTDGNARSYYPDFYIYDWRQYIDIKNDYHYELQKEKFEMIKNGNPDLDINIMLKHDLTNKGINL